jgi:5'-nucleotidase
MPHRRSAVFLLAAFSAVALAAAPVGATAPAKKKGPAPLRVLVTNDDGVDGEGMDLLVQALLEEPKVKVTVVAPTGNRSGSSDTTTPGPLTATEATTPSGYDATAVDGFPADSVIYALDELGFKPHVVISGINFGQNLGPAVDLSGTVGAAKTAVRRGIPALAVSQGLADQADYPAAVDEAIKWLKANRKALAKAKGKGATELANLNVPTCLVGEVRGLEDDLPVAAEGEFVLGADRVDCDSRLTDPADDVEAFNNGFATLSEVPAD